MSIHVVLIALYILMIGTIDILSSYTKPHSFFSSSVLVIVPVVSLITKAFDMEHLQYIYNQQEAIRGEEI